MFSLENIEFYYQPIYNRNLDIYGFEILSRLINSTSKQCASFIEKIENDEIIVDIALGQLSTVCGILDEGIDCTFSINVNEFTLASPRFLEIATQLHKRYLNNISLEISEKINLKNRGHLVKALDELNKYGYLLGLDDLFSEDSSTMTIMKAEISYIKADRTIVEAFKKCKTSRNLLQAMVYFCKVSSIPCVAEGVESLETYYELKSIGVDFFQGFYFSKPVPLNAMFELYHKKNFDIKNH
ncbi:EAL domain-containing protein [Enterobacter ludwigii]